MSPPCDFRIGGKDIAIVNDRARLCQALRGELPAAEVRRLMPAAVREGVDGWLAPECFTGEALARWEQAHREARLALARKRHALAQIVRAFTRRELPFVVLRGFAVADRYWGARAETRPISDLDLIVEPQRLLEAKDALWKLGFRPHPLYKDMFLRGDVQVDLHWEPLGFARIRAWERISPLRFAQLWDAREPWEVLGESAWAPAPELDLVYLAFHAVKHSLERLVWLWDLVLVAREVERRGGWTQVVRHARELRLARPAFLALSYAARHLGAPVPEEVRAALAPEMSRGERRLFARVLAHEVPPFLAERIFARMQPGFVARLDFWRETIWPAYEVRAQIAGSGCVKCNFIRKRLRQALRWAWDLVRAPAARTNG